MSGRAATRRAVFFSLDESDGGSEEGRLRPDAVLHVMRHVGTVVDTGRTELEVSRLHVAHEQLQPAAAGGERVEVIGGEDCLRENHADQRRLVELELRFGQLVLDHARVEEGRAEVNPTENHTRDRDRRQKSSTGMNVVIAEREQPTYREIL